MEIFDHVVVYIVCHKGELAFSALLALITFGYKEVRGYLKVKADLHPYYTTKETRLAARYFTSTRIERMTHTERSDQGLHDERGTKLIPFFINKAFSASQDDQQFYMILADSGMGKTTFLINLYLRYTKKIFRKRFQIDMMSLWHPKTWDRLKAYPEEKAKDTLLLLDALDEDPKAIADVHARLNAIVDKTYMFRKVIICCSPESFKDELHEPSEIKIPHPGSPTGYHNFLKIYLAPFSPDDIEYYIRKRISIFNWRKRKAALELMSKSPQLMKHPLLLSYIDDLIATGKKYVFAYEVYDSLINKWIAREASQAAVSGKASAEYKSQLWTLSKAFAYNVFIRFEKMNQSTQDGFYLTEKELGELVKSTAPDVDLSVFRTKSLITRNETGEYKFTHFSMFEFFLAQIVVNREYGLDEERLKPFKNAMLFFQEIFMHKMMLPYFAGAGGKIYTKMNNTEVDIFGILTNGSQEKVDNLFVSGLNGLKMMMLTPLRNILTLQVIDSPIEGIDSISRLRKLQTLNFENCNISDITPLKFLNDINHLCLKDGAVQSIEPLTHLTDMQILNLENNRVTDLSPLANMKKLRRLNVVKNNIKDLTPLRSLENLSWLFLAGNPVSQTEIDALKSALPGCSVDTTKDRVYV